MKTKLSLQVNEYLIDLFRIYHSAEEGEEECGIARPLCQISREMYG